MERSEMTDWLRTHWEWLIEGASKNMVGRRTKQTGAYWRLWGGRTVSVKNGAGHRMALVCSLLYAAEGLLENVHINLHTQRNRLSIKEP